jgi:hypothetical protein
LSEHELGVFFTNKKTSNYFLAGVFLAGAAFLVFSVFLLTGFLGEEALSVFVLSFSLSFFILGMFIFLLQSSDIFSKEVFKFFLGQESINHYKVHIFSSDLSNEMIIVYFNLITR